MRRYKTSWFLFLLIMVLVCSYAYSVYAKGDIPIEEVEKIPESTDITDKVREINSDKYLSPPTQFRKGHVTARQLDKKALETRENGYAIQLPSKAPVPTPAVYKGKVFVSGGFRSKEFYAFDAKTGKLHWGVNLDDDGPSTAVVRDGVVIFNTESCTIFALDTETGKQLWSWWLGDPLMSAPAIANGRVFASYPATGRGSNAQIQVQNANIGNVSVQPKPEQKPTSKPDQKTKPDQKAKQRPPASHVLAAFDLKTGKILWQRWIDSDVMSAPVAIGDELYVTTFAGTIYKFKQIDGKIISAKKARATSAPVIYKDRLFYTKRADQAGSGKVEEAAVQATRSEGKEISVSNKKAAPYLDGTVQSRTTYQAMGESLDAANGFVGGAPASANAGAAFGNVGQQNVSTLQAFQGSRILSFGKRNYNVMGDEILCNDAKSGKKLWSQKLSGDMKAVGGFIGTPPVVAGGKILIGTYAGEVLIIDPDSGKTIQKYKVGSPVRYQPVVQDGSIFIGTEDGKLVCINTQDPTLTGWAMWGGDAAHTGFKEKQKGKESK